MDQFNKLKNSGFTLLQSLFGVGIVSFLALTVVTLMKRQTETSESAAAQFELIYLVDDVKALLSDPEQCRLNLSGKNPRYDNLESLQRRLDDQKTILTTYQRQEVYAQEKLQLLRIIISDESPEIDFSAGNTELILSFKHLVTRQDIDRKLKINIEVDDRAMITNCSTSPPFTAKSLEIKPDPYWSASLEDQTMVVQKEHRVYLPNDASFSVPKSDALIVIEDGLQIKGQEVKECDESIFGALRLSATNDNGALEYCSAKTRSWKKLKYPSLNQWSKSLYEYTSTTTNKSGLNIRDQVLCYLSRTNMRDGECRLRTTGPGHWILEATQQQSYPTDCQATCYSPPAT